MKIKEKSRGNVVILWLAGDLLGEPEISDVRMAVYKILNEGVQKIVLDLSKVGRINSTGLGSIMAAHASCRSKDSELRLANVSDHVGSVLVLTKVVKVIRTYETVDKAVKSF
jgi:anti-sigma B factor antagonist